MEKDINDVNTNNEEKKNNKVLILVIIVAVIAAIAGALFAGKIFKLGDDKKEDNKPQENVVISDYSGRYDSVDDNKTNEKEYIILKADGTASIHYVTGDNGAYGDLTSKYSITTVDGKNVLKFDDLYDAEGLYWYQNYLDVTGTTKEKILFTPRVIGPSEDGLKFAYATYVGKWKGISQEDPEDLEYFTLNEDGKASIHYMTGEGYADDTVNYSIDADGVLTFDINQDNLWKVLDATNDKGYTEYKPRNIDETPSALDLVFVKEAN